MYLLCIILHEALYLYADQLSISVTPINSVIFEKGTAQFTATASGINMRNFVYQWRKRGNSSLPNKVSGGNGAVLTIPNLVKSDEGQYYCTVTNEWGNSVKSDYITFTVQGLHIRKLLYEHLLGNIHVRLDFKLSILQ